MARQRSSRSILVPVFAVALAATGCASTGETDESIDWGTTGTTGGTGGTAAGGGTTGGSAGGSGSLSGGSASGGTASGGTASGGTASGGLAAGGIASGGTASGGTASGGTASGGTASGGTASGGTASGGTASGGTASGGTASGGTASGGTASGGTASGGTASGGTASGGTASGGTASGGTASGGTASGGTSGGGRTAGGAATGGGTTGGSGIFGGLFGGGGAPVDRSALDCCKGEDCSKCITEPPASVSGAQRGPYGGFLGGGVRTVELAGGTTYVPPEDAKGPWPGFAIVPGFTNVGPEMEEWGPFFASWGIVTVITNSGPLDTPGVRGQWLLDAIGDLKAANTSDRVLTGKLSGQYGTGGYSMGGGGTTVASQSDKTLRSSIGLAPWTPAGAGIVTPTIHFCGTIDVVADCSHAEWSYADIPDSTPKALVTVSGCDHLLCWFGPADATGEISGQLGLIWNKVYLEGDTRWKKLLTDNLRGGLSASVETNVQ